MNILQTRYSKQGFPTEVGFDFESDYPALASGSEVDSFIVATECGFSPLGKALPFFAADLGIPEGEITHLADWNRTENNRVTLIALASRRDGGQLRGVILAPCETSECYKQFATPIHGRAYRDFFYNVTYEAIAYACKTWKARKLGISHLSASGGFHEDIATCNAEALAHFCDEATDAAALDSFAFVGCCIAAAQLEGIKRLKAEGSTTRHRAITVEIEIRDGVAYIHISWSRP